MAIPIRLLAGLGNETVIDLIAQSIDMSVDRNVSAFPTPNNYLKRFAVDTNIPRVKIDINGIFVDDDIVDIGDTSSADLSITSQTPASMIINFASMLPTKSFAEFTPTRYSIQPNLPNSISALATDINFPTFTANANHSVGSTTSILASTDDSTWSHKTWEGSEELGAKMQSTLKFTSNYSADLAPGSTLAVDTTITINGSAVSVTDYEIAGATLLNVGDRLIKSDGTYLGIVASIPSDTTITLESHLANSISSGDEIYVNARVFNEREEFVGYASAIYDDSSIDHSTQTKRAVWTIQLIEVNKVLIRQSKELKVNKQGGEWNTLLDEKIIKLIPSYWLENPSRNPNGGLTGQDTDMENGEGHIGIRLKLNAGNTSVDYTSSPSISNLATGSSRRSSGLTPNDAGNFDAIINVPVKDIMEDDNPAKAMATQVKAALELTGDVAVSTDMSFWIRRTEYNNSTTITYANAQPGNEVKRGMLVTGTGIPANAYVKSVTSSTEFELSVDTTGGATQGGYLTLSTGIDGKGGLKMTDAFVIKQSGPVLTIIQKYIPEIPSEHPESLGKEFNHIFNTEVFHSNSFNSVASKKSAGDKVQDLIGIVSNASKTVDLLRGIQIPYDSLITSSGVTGVARNFFLTFGEIPISEKGALANERNASELMNEMLLTADWGGTTTDKGERNLWDKFADALIPDEVQALGGFLINSLADMWVTLTTPAHGNDGGIRIIPERLHVRYDAGNNYYAFNLELIASDFVIGV
tara:strand:- start:25282 stop:27540 length:2259 start_codon:yes stop_codon:yes gene_type:complete